MIVAVLPGVGELRDLEVTHLEDWNAIAGDDQVYTWLNLQRRTSIDPDRSLADLPSEVRAGEDGFAWRDGVLVGLGGSALAAVQLKVYPCSADNYGLSVDYAVIKDHRGQRLGATITRAISEWITSEVPGAHVHIEVCSKNGASLATARILGMTRVDVAGGIECNIHSGGLHKCDQVAERYCLGPH